jgi:hypothetical protein
MEDRWGFMEIGSTKYEVQSTKRMKAAGGEFFFADRKERKFHGGN